MSNSTPVPLFGAFRLRRVRLRYLLPFERISVGVVPYGEIRKLAVKYRNVWGSPLVKPSTGEWMPHATVNTLCPALYTKRSMSNESSVVE